MKLAVTFENGEVFRHFGQTREFKIYEINGGKIVSSAVKDTGGRGHGDIVNFLKEESIDALICGGLGNGAKNLIEANGIKLCSGITGSADKAAEDFAAGRLSVCSEANCKEHEDGHNCSCGCH